MLVLVAIMQILQAKVLITILFYIETTSTEPVKIIRTLEGKNWTTGVDSFHIPHSVCYQESTGCRRCNKSYATGITGNYSRCLCSKRKATVTYINNEWRCLKNQEVRNKFGCGINSTLFAGEKEEHRLRTLNTAKARKTKLIKHPSQCKINFTSSWYIGCFGKKIFFRDHYTKNSTTEMFLLENRTRRNDSYFIQVNKPVDPILRGKVINLGITCEPPTSIADGCLLFKLEGNFTCSEVTPTRAVISSAINPKTTSKSTASGGKQSGIIVGVSVSAALFLFILAAVLFICRCRRSREDTQTSSNKDACKVSRNTKTNSASELDELDGYEICKDPPSTYASRYDVPQQKLLQGPPCNQKSISPEVDSHSDGAYASLNIPEGHHIYGPGNVQDPVYNVLQGPKIMFQNFGSGINQPVYNALEDLSVKDLVESVNNGPTDSEPVHNVLEDPEVMFQNYGSGIDQPMYYALEDLTVKDSVESVNNRPTDPEPVHSVLEGPQVMFQNCGCGVDQPMYYALEDLTVKDSVQSANNGPTELEPVYHVLEAPGRSGTKTSDGYDPENNVLEGLEPNKSSEDSLY